MNKKQLKPRERWLESEEGRIITMIQHGFLSPEVGQRLLVELHRVEQLKTKKLK